MAISRKVCIVSTVVGIVVSACVVGVSVWFAVPHSNNANGSNPEKSNSTPSDPTSITNINRGLLVLNNEEIQLINLNSIKAEAITLFKLPFSVINAMDYYRNKTVYYTSINGPIKSVSKEYPNLMPFNDELWTLAIAVDVVCKNVFVYDWEVSRLYVFDMQNKYSGLMFSDLYGVKDIAVNSFTRWIAILTTSGIAIADMDGKGYEEIVKENDIEAFAVDQLSHDVYWAGKNKIMSLYVGLDPITVVSTTNIVRSLAVSDKDLHFTMDSSTYGQSTELYTCKMNINGVCDGGLQKIIADNPRVIKPYMPHLWEDKSHPCEYQNGGCEQLCLLKRNSKIGRSCACSIGWQLNNDAQTCSPIEEYIMYINSTFLKGRIMDQGSNKAFVDAITPRKLVNMHPIPEEGAIEFDFDSRRHRVIFRDQYSLHQLDLLDKDNDRMISRNDIYAMYPAVDWIARDNLYYVKASRKSDDESYVMLRGYTNFNNDDANEKEIFKFEKMQHPHAIVVQPNSGYFFVTVYEDSSKTTRIYKIVADGSSSTAFDVQNKDFSVNKIGLGIDNIDNRLYWFSADLTKVQYANIDASDFKSFDISFVKEPKWLNIHGQWLYISSLEGTWRVDKMAGFQPQRILSTTVINNYGLSAAKGFGTSTQPIRIDHPCATDNGGCSRYCIAVPETKTSNLRRICACNDNEELQEDGKSCALKKHEKSTR